jgi:hypothetical protein
MTRVVLAGLSVVLGFVIVFALAGAPTVAVTPTPSPTPTSPAGVPPVATSTPMLLPATVEPTATAQQDADEFARLKDEALKRPLVYGPANGSLPMQQSQISIDTADVSVRDFAVHVAFTNPASAAEHAWDYGIVFRLTDQHSFQLGVHSSGQWFMAVDTAQPDQSGEVTTLNFSANGTNYLDLIAIGDKGYFGVNGSYVTTLDLSANEAAGRVAVAASFFNDSYIAGGTTAYKDFIIWSFDTGATPVAGSPAPRGATPTPVATAAPPPASPSAATNSYTSPTYGYSLTWDDTWQEVSRTSQNGVDVLRLSSNAAFVDLEGFPWTGTADGCIDGLVSYYQGQSGYSDVKIATDATGNPQRGRNGATAWAVIDFSLTSNGSTDAYADYVECHPLVANESMLSFEYVTFATDFDAQKPERDRLLANLTLAGEASVPASPAAASPAATSASALGPIGLTLNEENGSGVSGLATLAETKDGGQTVVNVLIVGAPAGTVAIIHAGTCNNLDPTPAYLLRPVDANGASETTIAATLRDLRVMGEYAIAVYASVGDLSRPIACGEIPTAG